MGNGYNQNFQYQRNLNLHKMTPPFLPMLCSKTSIKDVKLARLEERSSSFSDDLLSPKISCMGQVKRNNKIIGFPIASSSCSHSKLSLSSSKSNNDVKYFKLKRLFSCRNILSSNNTSSTVSSCRKTELMGNDGASVSKAPNRTDENQEREEVSINIPEMDPPLPVIKRVPKKSSDEGDDGNSISLWKRRSSGGGLRTLELQKIKIPRHHQVGITTV